MKIKWNRLNRKTHYWGAIICAAPILIVIITGILLLLKKEVSWIQPPTIKAEAGAPALSFQQILEASKKAPEAEISTWDDIDRIDVRPNKGVIKVRAENSYEIQLDHDSGELLQVAYRRNELIESLHDGSWFHDSVKLWVFLPSAVILLVLWLTGIYLFIVPLLVKRKRRKEENANKA
ncbi:MAG: PepSY-associated TM helix domain-containing protein [Rubritalea sp.]|uniref:PepSY-associated TM helix domain-containing protein n=1 Tax=Rubritalea sp. TaxID=2109375 RepID=UPI0032425290